MARSGDLARATVHELPVLRQSIEMVVGNLRGLPNLLRGPFTPGERMPDVARHYDAIVMGAGPAGALAARQIALRGRSVLLVEKNSFPRTKVCGCCLNPRALGVLDRVGLGGLVTSLGGVPLNRFQVASRGRSAQVKLLAGAAVSRDALDLALAHAATSAGANFQQETSAFLEPGTEGPVRTVRLRDRNGETSVTAPLVIQATGLGSKVAETISEWEPGSRVGAGTMVEQSPAEYQPHIIYMACGTRGYVGLVRVEAGRLDVAAALDPIAIKASGGPGVLSAEIIRDAGFPEIPGLADSQWKGTPHLTRTAPRLGGHRTLVLGDAAGYVEPFTGEGMAWALAGAEQMTPLAIQAIDSWDETIVARWAGIYRTAVKKRQLVCRFTAGLMRRPRATSWLVRSLRAMPVLARPALWMMK